MIRIGKAGPVLTTRAGPLDQFVPNKATLEDLNDGLVDLAQLLDGSSVQEPDQHLHQLWRPPELTACLLLHGRHLLLLLPF